MNENNFVNLPKNNFHPLSSLKKMMVTIFYLITNFGEKKKQTPNCLFLKIKLQVISRVKRRAIKMRLFEQLE